MSESIARPCVECHAPTRNGSEVCPNCLLRRADALLPPVESIPPPIIPWRSAAEVEEQDTEWLWWNRIPLGEVTLVAGDPGQGKSQFTMALAAKVSTGFPLPDGGGNERGTVMVASLEDHPNKAIVKRLRHQGADMSRVLLLDQFKNGDGSTRRLQASDIPTLEAALTLQPETSLIIVDPVMAYVGDIDTNKDNQVRNAMSPLVEMAQRHNIAIVVVAHLNKTETDKILYKVSGSVGFGALPRSVLLIGQEESSGRRGIAHIKSNLGPMMDTVEFTLDGTGFHWGQLAPELTARRISERQTPSKTTTPRDIALDWLKEFLGSGPKYTEDIKAEATALGHAWRTIMRIKSDLGIKHEKFEGKYRWII